MDFVSVKCWCHEVFVDITTRLLVSQGVCLCVIRCLLVS